MQDPIRSLPYFCLSPSSLSPLSPSSHPINPTLFFIIFLILFFFINIFFFLEKESSRGCEANTPRIGCLPLGKHIPLFCEESGTKMALLSSSSCLCQYVTPGPLAGNVLPRFIHVPHWGPGGE